MGILDTPAYSRTQADARYAQRNAPLRQLTDNCWASALDTPTQSAAGTSRTPHYVAVSATGIRLVYSNWYSVGSTNDNQGTATYTVNASIEDPVGGAIYRVTFGGRTSATIDPAGYVTSDEVALDVAAGQTLWVRTYISATTWYSNKFTSTLSANGGWTATTDLTAPGSAAIANVQNAYLYGPTAILGHTNSPAILGQGDSIMHGYQDSGNFIGSSTTTTERLYSGGGWLERGARGKFGIINAGISSDQFTRWVANVGHYHRMKLTAHASHAIIGYGRNDVSNGVTLASMQANLLTSAAMNTNRGLRSIATTVCPKTTSTDDWCTLVNQTPETNAALRVSYNQWLRAGAPLNATTLAAVAVGTTGALLAGQHGHPLVAVWDIASLVESSTDSGYWKVPRVVTDATIATNSTTLTSATANFTSADIGKETIIVGAAAGGTNLKYAKIQSVTNATTATITGSGVAVGISNGTVYIGTTTPDGIHPGTWGATVAAAAVNVTDLGIAV